jgi:hypothetical protein
MRMKAKKMKYLYLLLLPLLLLLISGCSTIKRYDDAVRIKEGDASKYLITPGTKEIRDGRTLHGTVVNVLITMQPDTCPATLAKKMISDTSVVFLDKDSPNQPDFLQTIPLSDIELIRTLYKMPVNQYDNINVFENFNNPDYLRSLRDVPVETNDVDPCDPCNCRQFSLDFDFNIHCIKRNYSWLFVELRGGYSVYTDYSSMTALIGRDAWQGEVAAGVRFGGMKEWGLGIAVNSGIKAYNAFKGQDYLRPTVLLHARYQSPNDKFLGLCMKPFVYVQFGMPVDALSITLFKFNFSTGCENCKKYIEGLSSLGLLPGIDFSLPLSYGIGFGFDLPVTPFLDLSFDAGLRSFAFGESAAVAGFENVPSMRRINMFIMRFGVTY